MTHNKENEVALLGAIMRDPKRFEGVAEIVTENDFSWACYAWAWKAIKSLHERRDGIDTVTVGDELARTNHLNDFTLDGEQGKVFLGRAALSQIRENGNPRNAETYAQNVLDYSAKRQLSELAGMIATWSANGRTASDIITDTNGRMAAIRTYETKSARHTQSIKEAIKEASEHTEAASRGEIEYVMTGYQDLDALLGGMSAPDLYVIAARPGQGKTAFLASVAKNASEAGKRVAIFTLEMKNSQIAMRLLAMTSGVGFDLQKNGKLSAEDWEKYYAAIEKLEDYTITLNDLPSIRPSQMRRELRRMGGTDLVIVDYIQLADPDGKYERRDLEVAAVTKELKAIAKEFNVPILAAAQLSRAVEMRSEKRPILSDLKESGGIEENADAVMFIYRPDQYEKDQQKKNIAEIVVAKHRNGPVGMVELVYRPNLTRFESKARY